MPIPKSSTPALLLTMVRSLVPLRRMAAMRFSGIPQRPKPPMRIVTPSVSFAMAALVEVVVRRRGPLAGAEWRRTRGRQDGIIMLGGLAPERGDADSDRNFDEGGKAENAGGGRFIRSEKGGSLKSRHYRLGRFGD